MSMSRHRLSAALGNYDKAKTRFITWIGENRPAAAKALVIDGDLNFSAANAAAIMSLVREWRASFRANVQPLVIRSPPLAQQLAA